jgi:Stage II sporulation protein E (SpoIIE)
VYALLVPGAFRGSDRFTVTESVQEGRGISLSRRDLPVISALVAIRQGQDMFVTFCYVAKKGEQFHLGLAGHPAILQFCARSNEVKKWECPNMPLGILPDGEFVSCAAAVARGDVFALYTDGLLETANAAGEVWHRAARGGTAQAR